jgi:Ca-activated chloride channel family protein
MEFSRPEFLYLLALVPLAVLLLVWTAQRRRVDLARIGTPLQIATLSVSVSRTRRRWKTVLWFMALIATILALARPRWGTQVHVAARRGVQVMVTLDVSASMLAEDIKPNRLARAKLAVEELMDTLGGNEMGLVLFSGAAFVQFPLTADHITAQSFLSAAGPGSISRHGTTLEEAIRVALDGFPKEVATSRVILLLTDGEEHEGDVLVAARAAADASVTIHAIGLGSLEGEPIPVRDANGVLQGFRQDVQGETVLSRLDESTLQKITGLTNGLYFRASASGDEIPIIADAIAALGSGEGESHFETQNIERYAWLAAVALLALTAELMIGDRVKREHQLVA